METMTGVNTVMLPRTAKYKNTHIYGIYTILTNTYRHFTNQPFPQEATEMGHSDFSSQETATGT